MEDVPKYKLYVIIFKMPMHATQLTLGELLLAKIYQYDTQA
jgi:hypothetical protein